MVCTWPPVNRMLGIIEIHNKEELERAINMQSELIGINNRNLNNFEINVFPEPISPTKAILIIEQIFY